jgi:hypothetical protein
MRRGETLTASAAFRLDSPATPSGKFAGRLTPAFDLSSASASNSGLILAPIIALWPGSSWRRWKLKLTVEGQDLIQLALDGLPIVTEKKQRTSKMVVLANDPFQEGQRLYAQVM